MEEEDYENVFCNVTSIFDEEQIYQFKCDECPEQFMLNRHMKNHVMTHIAITTISCNECKKLFTHIREFQEKLLFKFSIECLTVLKDEK